MATLVHLMPLICLQELDALDCQREVHVLFKQISQIANLNALQFGGLRILMLVLLILVVFFHFNWGQRHEQLRNNSRFINDRNVPLVGNIVE